MTGRARAHRLADRLGSRDLAILGTLRELRLASGNQLGRLHVEGDRPTTQARKVRATLQRLTDLHAIVRLERRVGGVRAGSSGFVYGLSGLGQAVLDLGTDDPHRHRRVVETKPAFHNHVLGVTEQYVRLVEYGRTGRAEVLEFAAEPRSWRRFPGQLGQIVSLKPDAYTRLGVDGYEVSAFLELDLDTESTPTIARKLDLYVAYWRSGIEQRQYGLFPKTWWLVPTPTRLNTITRTIQRLPAELQALFTTCLIPAAVDLLTQPQLEGGAR